MHLYVHCGIIYNIQDMKATYMSIDRWMDKENVLSICLSIYLSTQPSNGILQSDYEEWNLATCDNMNGSRRHVASEIVRQRKTNTVWFHLHMKSKKQKRKSKTKTVL